MRIGMMQPYFFPYLGYFGLMDASDQWIVFDTPQYVRRSWINRNRVLSDGKNDWTYIRIPTRYSPVSTPIKGILIDNSQNWRGCLIAGLEPYRLWKAPKYSATVEFLQDTLAIKTNSLCELLIHALRSCCTLLGITASLTRYSEMTELPVQVSHPGEWALSTTRALRGTTYINAPGGRALFDPDQFKRAGIELLFLDPGLPTYPQSTNAFVPGLSVVDALMWNDTDAVRDMITEYKLRAA